ncbi:MAG TPA: hypothetical protein VJT69_18410 [Pyrinomonadaceae bacterium]|nr:hypothetical protein [Pyrinomonadaceae bacterium]
MRHCPECDSFFPDTEQFCEADGTPLETVGAPQPKSNAWLLPIGALIGILLAVLLFLVYFAVSRQPAPENSNTISSSSSAQQQVVNPRQTAPLTAESPSPEASEEPSESPSVEPSPQSSPAQIELSGSNPISTAGGKGSGPVVIRLQSGATIEADEAWQTGEGIWYRKHSVVSLLDPRNVKAIEKVSPAAPQASASPSP